MGVRQIEPERPRRRWRLYLIGSLSLLLSVLLVAVLVYFWDEIKDAKSIGYPMLFFIGVMGGITVIPAPPPLVATFALGGRLNPTYVGLIVGLGEALGGITVYLAGSSIGTVWSRLRSRQQTLEQNYDISKSIRSRFWSKGEVLYNRLLDWVSGRGAALVVFVASALPISPFYFAGLAAGSLRMGLLRFFLVSWAGKTIKGLGIAYAGYWGLHYFLKWIGA